MSYLSEHFANYDCDKYGNVYKNGKPLKQCNSNGYKQVTMRDENFKRRICGVHQVIAMKYLEYYDGCIVHHKDKNRCNNKLENLEVKSPTEHKHQHGIENVFFKTLNKGKPAWNKGLKMSKEFSDACKSGIEKNRKGRKNTFRGNQYVDKNKNKI